MSRRRKQTPISKPEIVLANAFKAALDYRSDSIPSGVKMGDFLASLDAVDGKGLWREILSQVVQKFSDKSFSRSLFWIACFKEGVNPLHLAGAIRFCNDFPNGKNINFCPYLDASSADEKTVAYEKVDKLLDYAAAFKAPYEALDWFQGQAGLGAEKTAHFLNVSMIDSLDTDLFKNYVIYSSKAKDFCLAHIERVIEHAQGNERRDFLTKIMDNIAFAGLSQTKTDYRWILAPHDITQTFEAALSCIDQGAGNPLGYDQFARGSYFAAYVVSRYPELAEFEQVANLLTKTGANGLTTSLGSRLIDKPDHFMALVGRMDPAEARHVFAHSMDRQPKEPASTIAKLDFYDPLFRANGLGTVKQVDALWCLASNYDLVKDLHVLGLVDFNELVKQPHFKPESFCSHSRFEWKEFLKDRQDIKDYVHLCAEVGAQSHIRYIVDEFLVKNSTMGMFASSALYKDFFEEVMLTKAIDPDEVLKTPLRIEKLIAIGVSPLALRSSSKYTGKWQDASFGADLGM